MRHKVQISGFAGTHEEARVVDAFALLFKISEEKAASLLSRLPLVIKEGLDAETAGKYAANLQRIGLRVEIIAPPVDELVAAYVPSEKTAALPRAELQNSEQPGFKFTIEGRPDYAFLTVQIPANQTLKVEASAMATMDTSLKMKTKLKGGFGRFLTGESLFLNDFTAENVAGEIGIAPAAPGDLAHVYLRGETIFLQNSAFVACDPAVTLETK